MISPSVKLTMPMLLMFKYITYILIVVNNGTFSEYVVTNFVLLSGQIIKRNQFLQKPIFLPQGWFSSDQFFVKNEILIIYQYKN